MMIFLNFYHRVRYCTIVILILLSTLSFAAFADSAPAQLTWQYLKDDALLGKQITLEAKHLPLNALLTQISQESGIKLSLAADSPLAQELVTAKITRMNLSDFMDAISRTYSAYWSKSNEGIFILTPKAMGVVDEGISQLGAPEWYRYRDQTSPSWDEIIKMRNSLYQKILSSTNLSALKSDEGIPLNTLPPGLATALKNQYRQLSPVSLLLKYDAYKNLSDEDIIRITIKQDSALVNPNAWIEGNNPTPWDDKTIKVEVLTPDKKQVTNDLLSWSFLGKWLPQKPKQ